MDISGHTRLLGFFADPAEHSQSPAMYQACFRELELDYCYLAFRIPEGEIGRAVEALRVLNMRGANISMPHKQKVIPYLDRLDETARLCGAVNTIVQEDGILTGYNTDLAGAGRALREMDCTAGMGSKRGQAVLLGLGGAGQAVLAALCALEEPAISVFVREPERASYQVFLDRLHRHQEEQGMHRSAIRLLSLWDTKLLKKELHASHLLVNSTSVGMGERAGQSLIPDPSYLQPELAVMDVIYAPRETELLRQACQAGCRAYKNGLDMLLYQGAENFQLFTGCTMPIQAARQVLDK